MNQYCYSEPVNKATLSVFPVWNSASETLDWEFTMFYSSLIDSELMQQLKPKWQTDDLIL